MIFFVRIFTLVLELRLEEGSLNPICPFVPKPNN